MKVLIISYFTSWMSHFATDLEIAQRHLDEGDTVEFLACDRGLGFCESNPKGKISKCDRCRLRRAGGISLLSSAVTQHALGDYLPADIRSLDAELESRITGTESAESYEYEGHDLGSGALSSAIWKSRDPLCETGQSRQRLLNLTKGALRSYLAVKAFLKAHPDIQKVYVFNGRFGTTRGALRACQDIPGLRVFTHERGPNIKKFSTYENVMPHNRNAWTRATLAAWEAAGGSPEAVAIGSAFYTDRKSGTNVDWTVFTENQEIGKLPQPWDTGRRNVVIFNSSEDEFVGLGEEWRNPIYGNQSEGLRKIITDAATRYPDLMFYLRIHPNLLGVDNRDTRGYQELAASGFSNFVIVAADSDISTYALLDAADLVITFGSTVGVEATFWGKPSILAAHSFYEDLDSVYVARNHTDVMDLIGTAKSPKPRVNAIKYGYYYQTFGDDFRHWVADDFSYGRFLGQRLDCEPKTWLTRRLVMFAKDHWRSAEEC